MAKVTKLIPVPSLTEQARQMKLAIICLAEKPVAAPEGYQDRVHAISMLAREAHDTIIDAEHTGTVGMNGTGCEGANPDDHERQRHICSGV